MDKLSGCRETAYEGKTNDVGAKKQKEQRNKGEQQRKQEEQKCKRKTKEIKRKAKRCCCKVKSSKKKKKTACVGPDLVVQNRTGALLSALKTTTTFFIYLEILHALFDPCNVEWILAQPSSARYYSRKGVKYKDNLFSSG